jgi:CBS domain-containing protein
MMSTMRKSEAPLVLHAQVAADLMIPDPISIRAEASIAEAMTLLTDRGIAAAPVIDEAGRPIGVLSRSDLLVHQCERAKIRDERPAYVFAFDPNAKPNQSTAADLMTPAIFAVAPDTPIPRVVSDMVGLHVHRLFVVDEAGVLVGVISTMDVLRALKPEE